MNNKEKHELYQSYIDEYYNDIIWYENLPDLNKKYKEFKKQFKIDSIKRIKEWNNRIDELYLYKSTDYIKINRGFE